MSKIKDDILSSEQGSQEKATIQNKDIDPIQVQPKDGQVKPKSIPSTIELRDVPTSTPKLNPLDMKVGVIDPMVAERPKDLKRSASEVVAPQAAAPKKVSSYEDIERELVSSPEPTTEELEKQRKKEKRDKTIAAISDGINAISSMYAASQGAPGFFGKENSQTAAVNKKYKDMADQLKEDKIAYKNGLQRAKALDAAAEKERLSWERTLQLDQEKRADKQYERKQTRKENKRKAEEREYQRSRDAAGDKRKAEATAESNRQWQAKFDQDAGKAATSAASKRIGLSDGKGEQFYIDDNVWKGSALKAYDILSSELNTAANTRIPQKVTEDEKVAYVLQNWTKSPKVAEYMRGLSNFNPSSSPTSANDDTVQDYHPNDEARERAERRSVSEKINGLSSVLSNDDIIDYNPNK